MFFLPTSVAQILGAGSSILEVTTLSMLTTFMALEVTTLLFSHLRHNKHFIMSGFFNNNYSTSTMIDFSMIINYHFFYVMIVMLKTLDSPPGWVFLATRGNHSNNLRSSQVCNTFHKVTCQSIIICR